MKLYTTNLCNLKVASNNTRGGLTIGILEFLNLALSSFTFRALAAGCKEPLLVRPVDKVFSDADLCALLGALHALYVVSYASSFSLIESNFAHFLTLAYKMDGSG